MKRTLIAIALGLMMVAPVGACTCGGDGDPGAEKAPASKDKKEETKKGEQAAKKAAPDPEKGEEGAGKSDEEAGAPAADELPGDEPVDKANVDPELNKVDGEVAEKGEEGEEPVDKRSEEDKKNKIDEPIAEGIPVEKTEPFEPGDVYKGPPSKAIVGKWKISLPKSSIPRGLPKEEREKLKKMAEITMEFDGRKATVSAGEEKETFSYKVSDEKGITMQLATKKGDIEDTIMVTFYDMDNILLNEPRYPGPARGARIKAQ